MNEVDSILRKRAAPNYVRHNDRRNLLRSVAGAPTTQEITAELAERDYVRQLRLISLDEVDIFAAVNDFLVSFADRTAWAAEGLVSAATLETYENDLHATWRHKLIRTRAIHAAKPAVNQGQLLFSDCIEHEARLNGLEIPRSFTRGSWHALADDSKIGWHPDYQNALTASKSTLDPTQNH